MSNATDVRRGGINLLEVETQKPLARHAAQVTRSPWRAEEAAPGPLTYYSQEASQPSTQPRDYHCFSPFNTLRFITIQ